MAYFLLGAVVLLLLYMLAGSLRRLKANALRLALLAGLM